MFEVKPESQANKARINKIQGHAQHAYIITQGRIKSKGLRLNAACEPMHMECMVRKAR